MAVEQLPDNEPIAAASKDRSPLLAAIFNTFGRLGIRLSNTLRAMAIFLVRDFVLIFHPKQVPEIINQVYFIGACLARTA